jgi:UDP-4-amino-4,6-dideoxy-L-N-acetyl-beta-L-altrosamine transaminase
MITTKDKRAVSKILGSDWIAGNGETVEEFEAAIAEYTGYKYAIAVNSATSGLFVAYSVVFPYIGIPQGQALSMPANTFVATANMAIAAGYKVKLVDTDVDGILRDRITHVSVTYSGNPEPQGIVGDDAHYVMRNMAQRSQLVSVLSTHAIKPITTGEGGVILTNDSVLHDKMRKMADHGRSKDGLGFGYNFRMPAINAAFGLSQLLAADENLETRKAIASMYHNQLRDILPVQRPVWHDNHCWHLYPIRVEDQTTRDRLRQFLFDNNIGTQVNYVALDTYDHIEEREYQQNAREYARYSLSIPMSAAMTQEDAQYVIDTIKEFYNA